MNAAYKYLRLPDGILFVFESEMFLDETDIPVDFIKQGNSNYLKINETHFVPLDKEVMEWLKETKKLYVASSEMFDPKIKMNGTIELDDISVGKILAYMEMETNS